MPIAVFKQIQYACVQRFARHTSKSRFNGVPYLYENRNTIYDQGTGKTNERTATIPTQDAINIYTIRSQLPSASNGMVKGFDELLQGLNKLNDDFVMIRSFVDSNKRKSMVFTDKRDKVVGILTFKNVKSL